MFFGGSDDPYENGYLEGKADCDKQRAILIQSLKRIVILNAVVVATHNVLTGETRNWRLGGSSNEPAAKTAAIAWEALQRLGYEWNNESFEGA